FLQRRAGLCQAVHGYRHAGRQGSRLRFPAVGGAERTGPQVGWSGSAAQEDLRSLFVNTGGHVGVMSLRVPDQAAASYGGMRGQRDAQDRHGLEQRRPVRQQGYAQAFGDEGHDGGKAVDLEALGGEDLVIAQVAVGQLAAENVAVVANEWLGAQQVVRILFLVLDV